MGRKELGVRSKAGKSTGGDEMLLAESIGRTDPAPSRVAASKPIVSSADEEISLRAVAPWGPSRDLLDGDSDRGEGMLDGGAISSSRLVGDGGRRDLRDGEILSSVASSSPAILLAGVGRAAICSGGMGGELDDGDGA